MEHKKYISIERLKDKFADGFKKGDLIIIQEKIDGANASFQYNKETDTIIAYSRRNVLGLGNNLNGFWEWTQKLDKEVYKDISLKELRFFGEWLVPHTVVYPESCYKKFYLFDVWNTITEEYMSQDIVVALAERLDLIYVPVFYVGKFESWENINKFIGKTELGGKYGEGIIIKNMTKLNDIKSKYPFYTKIVCDEFTETKKCKCQKPIDLEQLALKEYKLELAKSIVTKARIVKMLHKMVQDDIIPVDWDEKNMSVIARNINSLIYHDCIKEEKEIVDEIGDTFGKLCGTTCMQIVRDMLIER